VSTSKEKEAKCTKTKYKNAAIHIIIILSLTQIKLATEKKENI
jgi:hypothetical protein